MEQEKDGEREFGNEEREKGILQEKKGRMGVGQAKQMQAGQGKVLTCHKNYQVGGGGVSGKKESWKDWSREGEKWRKKLNNPYLCIVLSK